MNIIAVTQARIGSSRLPAKVLEKINDVPLLQIHLERLSHSRKVSKIKVATTQESDAILIGNIAALNNVECFYGSTEDVLDRYYQAVKYEKPDYVVRVTSDCPLIDATVIDEVCTLAVNNQLEYASNTMLTTFPDGLDVEIFTFQTLEKAWRQATLPSDREHVTPYIWRNSSYMGGYMFASDNLKNSQDFSFLRLTVDERADLELIRLLIGRFGDKAPWKTYVDYLMEHSELQKINKHIIHNEGYLRSLQKDSQINYDH